MHNALLTASGYRAARDGLGGLRRGHIGFRGVRAVRRHVANERHDQYVDFEHLLIEEFMLDAPSLTGTLEQLSSGVCEYNPFRQFRDGTYDTLLLPAYWSPPGLPADGPAWLDRTG